MSLKITFEKLLGALLLLTLLAVVGERWILQTQLTIEPGNRFGFAVYDDRVSGGESVGEMIHNWEAYEWQCQLDPALSHPFCGFELIFDPVRQNGLDLGDYDTVRLWLDYEGPSDTIRLYLRNFDKAYSIPGQNDTTKYNQVEFNASTANPPLEFALRDFFVANWWAQAHDISPQEAHPEFGNIVVLEVATSTSPAPGRHHFQLKRIEFTGQKLTTLQWYQLITTVWVAAAVLLLASRIYGLKQEVTRRRQREQELVEINCLLDARGKALEEKAKTDPLTGAFNRQGIKEALGEGLSQWRLNRRPLTLILLDIDRFKAINDHYGHHVGDQVLGELSSVVQDHIREGDVFARWGGEEFVLVCQGTTAPYGKNIADKLREIIAAHDFAPVDQVTVSIGVATLQGRESIDQLFVRADEALYKAKETGRNRVVMAKESAGNQP